MKAREHMMNAAHLAVAPREVDGLEMGVLADGSAFLGTRALARLCGVDHSALVRWAQQYDSASAHRRDQVITRLLRSQDHFDGTVVTKLDLGGAKLNVHTDAVCMAVLEYYAFEARPPRPEAQDNYRKMARHSLREFIYRSVGYQPDPERAAWHAWEERMDFNDAPRGYFTVFKHTSDFVLASIRAGLRVDQHTVPDISVGLAWAKHWEANDLAAQFGARVPHPHVYPSSYAQSSASVKAWCYPKAALAEFHRWLEDDYVPERYPTYLQRKVKDKSIAPERATALLDSLGTEALLPATEWREARRTVRAALPAPVTVRRTA